MSDKKKQLNDGIENDNFFDSDDIRPEDEGIIDITLEEAQELMEDLKKEGIVLRPFFYPKDNPQTN